MSVLPLQWFTAKMRLYLAVALLMLALVAYTGTCRDNHKISLLSLLFLKTDFALSLSLAEAQEDTFEQKITKFGEQITEMSRSLAEKAKNAFQDINNSEFAANAKYVHMQKDRTQAFLCLVVFFYLTHIYFFLCSPGTGSRSSLRSCRVTLSRQPETLHPPSLLTSACWGPDTLLCAWPDGMVKLPLCEEN